jgi:hypothetical protein
MTKYIWGISDGDVLFGPCATVDEAEKDAREFYDDLEEATEIVVWDTRPATQADAELFEGYDDLNDEEIDTTKPGWEQGRLVPENDVKRFTIHGKAPSSSNPKLTARASDAV